MLMGSDYPHMLGSIDRAVSSIQNLTIPEHEKQQIFSGTALSVLNNSGGESIGRGASS
jgi:predicted TIM-barrel fold metal-dependent hydrolase